jgi:hypothetical protein
MSDQSFYDLLRGPKWNSKFKIHVRTTAEPRLSMEEDLSDEETLPDKRYVIQGEELNNEHKHDCSGEEHSNGLSHQQAIYNPLPRGTIRLLRLLAGRNGEDIRCELVVTSLETKPRYEAVSYAWGYSPNRLKIYLNGRPFWIGHNLFQCLRNIRYNNQDRVLWIDALCIDQADMAEKSVQIEIMAEIYQSASSTLIWLGNDKPCDRVWVSSSTWFWEVVNDHLLERHRKARGF